MAAKKNNLLTYGALGFGAYWLWTHRQTATAVATPAATTDPSLTTPAVSTPTAPIYIPTTSVNAPNPSVPVLTAPVGAGSQTVCGPYGCTQTSNFNTPTTGPVATCMSRKPNWNQSQCDQRLAALVAALPADRAGLATSDTEAARYVAPMANAQAIVTNPATPSDAKAKYQAWINGATTDLAQIAQRKAAWQAAYDGHRNEYHNLTGVWL